MKNATRILVLGLVLGLALTASPASGHVKGSVAHLAGHLKATFFTKAESDARFVNVGEKVASATQADRATSASQADTATVAEKAKDAETLDGVGPQEFLYRNGTAVNSERLGGLYPNAYMPSYMWNLLYGRNVLTYGLDEGGQSCDGNEVCFAAATCDTGDVALSGGHLAVDNGTHVQDAVVLNSALTASGEPDRFYFVWRNNATADQVNVVVWCFDKSAL